MMKEQNNFFSGTVFGALSQQDSFEALYNEYFAPLYRYVYFRTKDKEIAMDIVQTTFLKVLEHGSVIKNNTALRYLYTIARNVLIDHFRKKRDVLMDNFDEFVKNVSDTDQLSPQDEVVRQDQVNQVKTLLLSLPETVRDIVTLRYLQELEYSEIAIITGKTESTIRKVVSRSLKIIKKELENTHYENT